MKGLKSAVFLTLIKVLSGRSADQPCYSEEVRAVTPPANNKVFGVYFSVGRYDGAPLFEASYLKSTNE